MKTLEEESLKPKVNPVELVRKIGIPNSVKSESIRGEEIRGYLNLAKRNKVPLLFLRSLSEAVYDVKEFIPTYEKWHEKALELVSFASELFREEEINYTFFKTFKPFPFTPSDVDVLLSSKENLDSAIERLEKEDLRPLDLNTYGSTLYSPSHDMNVDLTTQRDVSGLVYLNKKYVFKETMEKKVRGSKVRVPKPHANLAIASAHALYKEQMFMLSDFYTFAYLYDEFEKAHKFSRDAKIEPSFLWGIGLTYRVVERAFGSDNFLANRIRTSFFEESFLEDENLDFVELPTKPSLPRFVASLMRKVLDDSLSRKSLPTFLGRAIRPQFASELVEHISRKRY
ncbi:hypothetical protein AKJ47_03085 [candidate division MSBL1 archaeon SCGC-AAA261G05]|uniref:Uncharacterized protein n=1 Tax=candidate division MSBL1 archaeon SCGC-AAA261G05 TaxID=1698276 RepID=A0A133V963_9EURY|nr:hypothetical protein AKJ47_03085 [candidate division MSBL1 archaeon SCGC-AAA261G05]